MAGPEVENEHASRSAADPASSIAFRSAVVAATRATDDVARREALRNAAGAAISLAVNGAESELRSLLTPDPVNANVTWSVACYQIGDLTPSAVRDFADAAEAVTTVSQCNDIGHVAAELVASTSMGLRWVALVRTNTTTQLRLPDADATSDSTGRHASELGDAQRRWRRRIAAWSEGTDAGIDLSDDDEFAPPSPTRDDRPARGPSRATGGRTPEPTGPTGADVAALREQLRAVERQLTRLDSVVTEGVGADEHRAGRLHAVLAEVEARLVDASLDTRSGLASVEHRLGERMASVRDTLVRGLDATATSAADTRELVDARSAAIAEALRSGVQRLGEQLTANERRLTELATGLGGVVERLDRLDQQARSGVEQVQASVRDDLAELADHLDAGHGVLDRRRQRAHEELVGVAERLVAAVAEQGGATDEATQRVLAAITDLATGGRATAAALTAAVDRHGDASTTALAELRAAVDHAATSSGATAEQILAAVEGVGAGVASASDEVAATVEQLRLDLTDAARDAGAATVDQHRKLTASLEDVRRELVNDAAITRGSVDGSLEGATARVVRQLTAQLELTRTGSRSDLAAAVIALRDEQQRERHAEERRRAGGADAAQAALLAAVERVNERIDRLEASQQALRESLVGP